MAQRERPLRADAARNRARVLEVAYETFAAEGIGQRGETAAFGVCQVQPATAEVGFEDAVFLLQVGDDLLLVTVDPASEHGK